MVALPGLTGFIVPCCLRVRCCCVSGHSSVRGVVTHGMSICHSISRTCSTRRMVVDLCRRRRQKQSICTKPGSNLISVGLSPTLSFSAHVPAHPQTCSVSDSEQFCMVHLAWFPLFTASALGVPTIYPGARLRMI
ncbi:hypothetical protein FKP32DRAFT_1378119 [Trametes sanguinea]|nr:hypothetical protein FKP32DRAFT_1378119 [Trametes sanguinea]